MRPRWVLWFGLLLFGLYILIGLQIPSYLTGQKLPGFFNTGQMGDTVGGILGPYIAVGASLLTFLAFWVQYEANKKQAEQFEKQAEQFERQSQDQHFYQILETKAQRIINSSVTVPGKKATGVETLPFVINQFKFAIDDFAIADAPRLIGDFLDQIDEAILPKLFQYENDYKPLENKMSALLKQELSALSNDEREEAIRKRLGDVNLYRKERLEVFKGIIKDFHYRQPPKRRNDYYRAAFTELENYFGTFFDNFYRSTDFLFSFAMSAINRQFYTDYLRSLLDKHEKVLLFYQMAAGKTSRRVAQFIIEHNIIGEVAVCPELFPYNPVWPVLDDDIRYFSSFYS